MVDWRCRYSQVRPSKALVLQRNRSAQQDVSVFDRLGAVHEGQLNCDELYDREVLRWH